MKKYFYFVFSFFLLFALGNCTPQKVLTDEDISNPDQVNPTPTNEEIISILIDSCEIITLLSPYSGQKFNARNDDVRPNFSWKSNLNIRGEYLFELYQIEEGKKVLVFETKTEETNLKWPEEVPWKKERENSEVSYEWHINSVKNSSNKVNNCKEKFSGFFIATTNRLEVYSTQFNSECKGYDDNGNVCYTITEEWTILNNRYPMVYLVTNNVYSVIDNNGNPISVSNFSSSPAGFPAATLNQSNTPYVYNISYEVCVPLGATYLVSSLGYRDTPLPSNISNVSYTTTQIPLEPCVCDFCDRLEDRIQATLWGSGVLHSPTDPMYDELILVTQLTYPVNVIRINAEIIEFEHNHSRDPICMGLCNKKDAAYGTFTDGPLLNEFDPSYSAYVNRLLPITGWKNTSFPYDYTNSDGSFVSRELVWESNSSAGVDISSSIYNFLSIGLPEYHSCCSDSFRICIRYSFTDIKCKVCDIVFCYEFDRTDETVEVIRTNEISQSEESNATYERSQKWFQKKLEKVTLEGIKGILKTK